MTYQRQWVRRGEGRAKWPGPGLRDLEPLPEPRSALSRMVTSPQGGTAARSAGLRRNKERSAVITTAQITQWNKLIV